MYNQYLKIKTTNTGKGVFTQVDIPPGVPIIEVTGDVHTEQSMPNPQNSAWLQVTNKFFIGPSGAVDDQIRHSCDPNCYIHAVGKRAILYSIYLIKAGSEITFDYSTTSTDTLDKWKLDCKCLSYKCRKVISGFQYLSEEVKEEYRKKGILPLFLTDKRFKEF